METNAVLDVVSRLRTAYDTRKPIPPVIETHPQATLADAYDIQLAQVRRWTADGQVVRGHKIGLASAAIQRQLGVDQPDYGHLTDAMFHLEHQPIPAATFIAPRIEPEIAFVLGRPLAGAATTVADAARAVEFVLPALEIVDSRIDGWRISIIDTVADNASSGGVVLGSTPVSPADVDLRLAGCVLQHNGEIAATGAGAAVLGSPWNALVWLANTLGRLGVPLEPGHVVLSGALTQAFPVGSGDTVVAEIAGIGAVTAVLSA